MEKTIIIFFIVIIFNAFIFPAYRAAADYENIQEFASDEQSEQIADDEQYFIKTKILLKNSIEDQIKILNILVKGNHKNIEYFENKEEYLNVINMRLKELVEVRNIDTFEILLKIIKSKIKYPRLRENAIELLSYYGEMNNNKWEWQLDKKIKAMLVLEEVLNDTDPDVRLQAAATLLSMGDAETALPVLDKLAKKGNTIKVLSKLYAFTEVIVNNKIVRVISNTKLWDEKAKDIFKNVLKHESDIIKADAASRLINLEEKVIAEPVLLDILKRLKNMKLYNYELTEKDYKNSGRGGKEEKYQIYVNDKTALNNAINGLEIIKSKKAIPDLKDILKNYEINSLHKRVKEVLGKIENQ